MSRAPRFLNSSGASPLKQARLHGLEPANTNTLAAAVGKAAPTAAHHQGIVPSAPADSDGGLGKRNSRGGAFRGLDNTAGGGNARSGCE